jgi:hypothetical protein
MIPTTTNTRTTTEVLKHAAKVRQDFLRLNQAFLTETRRFSKPKIKTNGFKKQDHALEVDPQAHCANNAGPQPLAITQCESCVMRVILSLTDSIQSHPREDSSLRIYIHLHRGRRLARPERQTKVCQFTRPANNLLLCRRTGTQRRARHDLYLL